MLAELAAADAAMALSILVKTLAYAATLLAAGGALVRAGLRSLDPSGRAALSRMTVACAIAAAALSLLRLPMRASFLMGGALEGAVDTVMLEIAMDSPLGVSVGVRLIGLLMLCAMLFNSRWAGAVSVVGAGLVAASFALRGHMLGEPRLLLALLGTAHILGLAFWIGALAPLHRAALVNDPKSAGALAREFGGKALFVVGGLSVAGAVLLALLGGASLSLLHTPYGEGFAVKLALFLGVFGLAALNKLRLTPALLAGAPQAGPQFRRSVLLEALLILGVLTATAAVTALVAPPNAA